MFIIRIRNFIEKRDVMVASRSMKNKDLQQQVIPYPDVDIPDPSAGPLPRDKKASAPKKRPVSKPPVASGQAFLPGLSRRGRPRSKNPITPSERAAQHRQKRLENGAKRLEVVLPAAVAQALEELSQHLNESRSDVVLGLILKARAKITPAHG